MTLSVILAGLALLIALALSLLLLTRHNGFRGIDPTLDARLRELTAAQNEIAGRFGQAIENQSQNHADLQRVVGDRIEKMDERLGVNLKESSETLGGLRERLKVIDEAQKNLVAVSSEVVTLKHILSDKQTRGAYAQGRMETIVRDSLPHSLYEFQFTLSNGTRPDCVIRLPDSKTVFVIDSKFPLECFEEFRAAVSDIDRKSAKARIRNDVLKHVKDIAGKYLLPGETEDPALMFVPSEWIYAELYESFDDVIQNAYRARVNIVSPSILMLAVNTLQTLLKNTRMREQAHLIQREIGELLKDTDRLAERVENLQRHLRQTDGDIKEILTSTEKIARRAERIEQVDVGQTIPEPPQLPAI